MCLSALLDEMKHPNCNDSHTLRRSWLTSYFATRDHQCHFFKQRTPMCPQSFPLLAAHNLREGTQDIFSCSSDTLHVWNISTGESLTNRKLAVSRRCDNTQYITAGTPVIPKLCELLHLAPAPGETTARPFPTRSHLYTDGHAPLTTHSQFCYLLSPVPLESAPALQGTLIFNWIYLYWKALHACKPLSY